jgi:hypothetical protein
MSDRWFRVTLDLEGIRRSMSRADGTEHTVEYVLSWLAKSGFRRVEESAWEVKESDLGAVEPREVRTIEPIAEPPPQ